MSVDTETWIRRPEHWWSALLEVSSDWDYILGALALERHDWHLLVEPPEKASLDQADPAIAAALTGGEERVLITLEPMGAPPEAFAALAAVVASLVSRCGGAAVAVDTGKLLAAPKLPLRASGDPSPDQRWRGERGAGNLGAWRPRHRSRSRCPP